MILNLIMFLEEKIFFFPKLEFSVLNAFNNCLCFDKCFPKHKNNFENKKKNIGKIETRIFETNKRIKCK